MVAAQDSWPWLRVRLWVDNFGEIVGGGWCKCGCGQGCFVVFWVDGWRWLPGWVLITEVQAGSKEGTVHFITDELALEAVCASTLLPQ